MKKATTKGGT